MPQRPSRGASRAFVYERQAPLRVRLLRAYLVWGILLVILMLLIGMRAFQLTARPPAWPAQAPCFVHSKVPCR